MKTKTLIPLILTAFLVELNAAPKADNVVTFRVTRFDPHDRKAPLYQLANGERLEVPLHNVSPPIKTTLRNGKFLDLFQSGLKFNQGKPKPSLSITIPSSLRSDLLLIFVPSKDTYTVLKVKTPKATFNGGSRMLINATNQPLAVKYGKNKPVLIKSAKNMLLKPRGKKPMIPVLISEKKNDRWKLVRSEKWPIDPRFRSYVFVYHKPGTNRIAVHAVPERLTQPE